VSPAGKRRAVNYLCDERSYAERNACRLVQQPRATQRYQACIDYEERRIRQRLHELARKHPGSGYRRMTQLLRREGLRVNRKRVQRLWREEGLRNPLRKRRKRARGHSENSCAMKKAEYKNHVWCWDFTMDETADGRRLKWFSVVDEFTRECLALEVERRMKAKDVVAVLTWLEVKHGTPGAIRSDNGPEFIARAIQRWLATRQVAPLYIAPGSPWENGYSESFNSRMKAEFADREVFGSLLEAKVLGTEYQRYWNQERLHSGIGYQTPAEFAAELGADSGRATPSLRPPQVRSTHQLTLISAGT
jgi:putative transposase